MLMVYVDEDGVRIRETEKKVSSQVHESLVVLLIETPDVERRSTSPDLSRRQFCLLAEQQLGITARVNEVENLLDTMLYGTESRSTTVTRLVERVASSQEIVKSVTSILEDEIQAR